jgi:putative transcriptional regulator
MELSSVTLEIPSPPRKYEPDDIKQIRDGLGMSQAQFAKFLFVSTKTVQGWEQGLRRPTSSAARLLQFIEEPDLLGDL